MVFNRAGRVLHNVRPLLFERQLFKESGVLLLELRHLLFKFVRHRLITLMIDNQSFQSSGLITLVGFLPALHEVVHALLELFVLLLVCDVLEVARAATEGMRAQREAVEFGRETLGLIPQIVVTDTHVAPILSTGLNNITVVLTI